MNCFNHHDRVAIGTCKACAKGLCMDCTVDLGHGLACKGKHEEVVESYNNILNFNKRTVASTPKNIYLAPVFTIIFGSAFLWYDRERMDFLFILGCVFIVYGVVVFTRLRATYANKRG